MPQVADMHGGVRARLSGLVLQRLQCFVEAWEAVWVQGLGFRERGMWGIWRAERKPTHTALSYGCSA